MYHGVTIGQQKAATQLIERILAKGWRISAYDGEAWAVRRSGDKAEVLEAIGNTGHDTLKLMDVQREVGRIVLVWGNASDGSDLVSDYSPGTDGSEVDTLIHEHWNARGDV